MGLRRATRRVDRRDADRHIRPIAQSLLRCLMGPANPGRYWRPGFATEDMMTSHEANDVLISQNETAVRDLDAQLRMIRTPDAGAHVSRTVAAEASRQRLRDLIAERLRLIDTLKGGRS